MTNTPTPFIQNGKRKREDLYLPILHFPVADPLAATNWIDTLGEKAFCGWLKLLTLADRKDKHEADYSKVPRSMEGLAKILKISKMTLYRSIIKPLWNHGLIELVEFNNDGKIKGQKYVNVVVFPYPQNDKHLENKELKKIRDYDTDYESVAKTNNKKRGTGETKKTEIDVPHNKNVTGVDTGKIDNLPRNKNVTPPITETIHNNSTKSTNIQKDQVIKRLSPKSKISDVDLQNAYLLYEKMLLNFPKTLKPNIEKWADEFRLLREKLGEPDETVKYIIDWSQNDSFWKGNIRSAKTFRAQYDKLYIQAKTDIEKQQQPNTTSMYDDLIEKQLREAAEKKERLERGNIRGNEINPDNKPFLS